MTIFHSYGSVNPGDPEAVAPHSAFEGASTTSSTINLLNTIVGAGILAMPFAYKANGVLLGTILISLAGVTAGFGLYLQSLGARYVPRGHASFFAVAKVTYPSLAVVFDLAIAVKCFGVGVSYVIIVGDLMPQICESLGLTHEYLLHRQIWVTITMAIVGPLSYLRKLDSLKYTSIVALASVGYLVIIVIGHFLVGDTLGNRGEVRLIEPNSAVSVLSALPIIVFAFTCHQNMFSVLNELHDQSVKTVSTMISGSIGTAGFLYMLVGLCGYFSFGDNVGGNIIQMYPYSIFSTIGRIAIVVLVLFSYPLQCHPCRASVNHVLHSLKEIYANRRHGKGRFTALPNSDESDQAEQTPEAGTPDNDQVGIVPLSTTTFVVLTTIILILSYIVSLTVQSLELMLAFVGATGSTSISFILPGLFAYSLLGHGDHKFMRSLALALSIWGITVAVVCLSINIYALAR
uniref:ARAD1B21538p n=1 Tax=Blastobotrys adeninivorans TaxID=409370 RepID=A0A060TC86_BLAAD